MAQDKRKIIKIAELVYVKNKKDGLKNDPLRDWLEAEAIYNNKPRYLLLSFWNFIANRHNEILALIAFFALAINFFMLINNMTLTDLNMRPYVSIHMDNPQRIEVSNGAFYGSLRIVFRNSGDRIPASKVSTQYYITTDANNYDDRSDKKWYEEEWGGFGSISIIPPKTNEYEPGRRMLPLNPEYYYFEAITSYEGLELNKKFWYHIKKVFYVDVTNNMLILVYSNGDWDKNRGFKIPALSSREEVAKLIEEIKAMRKKKTS